ncbi:MAG: NAD(P)-binding domain-containing protein [Candidatus Eisenbacteria bacterium]|nr:NAD(P)-binding domain-containing protein [Candidatus Eisenbacteria bacterium]
MARYARWLHTGWPAGQVEKLPEVRPDGGTSVPGVYVCGDLAGVPLLKFALDTGARVARTIASELGVSGSGGGVPDLLILGAGVAGMAAALEARRLGLIFEVLEAAEPFATLVNFPRAKPIFTYPAGMQPAGGLQVSATVKEALLGELRAQVGRAGIEVRRGRAERIEREGNALAVRLADGATIRARRVLVAIGRSGDFRMLGVPGEHLDKVYNRLHDPADYRGKDALVVGGGDSAVETAVALAEAGARVTLAHRGPQLSRAKGENVAKLEALSVGGAVSVKLHAQVREIRASEVVLAGPGGEAATIANDVVFAMVGREAPLEFLRRSGIRIAGEGTAAGWIAVGLFLAFLALLYDWKAGGFLEAAVWSKWAWPGNAPELLASLGSWWSAQVGERASLVGTVAVSMKSRSFYYTLLYTALVGWFGIRRIRSRNTPYVTAQTLSLFLVQAIPLFVLPEIVLPWLGYNGVFSGGAGKFVADRLFESYIPAADYAARHWPDWGHPRAYWRAYGLILAWPLNVYNIFTEQPLWWWIGIGFVQTFVLLPLAIRKWGKGVYCGWICSCGALAETLGDTQRGKMPHGPGWNRLNMTGQVFLAFAFALLGLRIAAWAMPASGLGSLFALLLEGRNAQHQLVNPASYKWIVDILFGGVIGVGFYFKYSGRVWCRFACPLAALMHVYARFSRFAIVAEKKKCISCNVCTSVCHQGIDVMNFANKGLPMRDVECVRCSACVQSCPTGVLRFGEVGPTGQVLRLDAVPARRRMEGQGR